MTRAYEIIAAAVLSDGWGTIESLSPKFPDLTREQIREHLRNAELHDLLVKTREGQKGRGMVCAMWEPNTRRADYAQPGEHATGPRYASVWTYAAGVTV